MRKGERKRGKREGPKREKRKGSWAGPRRWFGAGPFYSFSFSLLHPFKQSHLNSNTI
jgi:hypothetical protein